MAIHLLTFERQTMLLCTMLCTIMFLVMGLAPIASAEDYGIVVKPSMRRSSGPPGSLFTTSADFTMPPSVTSSSLGARISRDSLTVACIDRLTGALIPGCTITITPEPEFGSGGHWHDGERPAGCMLKAGEQVDLCLQMIAPGRSLVRTRAVTAVTGADGTFDVTYVAPEVSGGVFHFLTGTDPQGRPLPFAVAFFDIRIPEQLVALPDAGPGFVMVPSPGGVHQNSFAQPAVVDHLMAIPDEFTSALLERGVPAGQIPTLFYTSLNLPRGGLFDINLNWRPPHTSHRFGNDADLGVSNIPEAFRRTLARVILHEGFHFPVLAESPANPNARHWHLRK